VRTHDHGTGGEITGAGTDQSGENVSRIVSGHRFSLSQRKREISRHFSLLSSLFFPEQYALYTFEVTAHGQFRRITIAALNGGKDFLMTAKRAAGPFIILEVPFTGLGQEVNDRKEKTLNNPVLCHPGEAVMKG